MDLAKLHRLALRTSTSLSDALQSSRSILEALQCTSTSERTEGANKGPMISAVRSNSSNGTHQSEPQQLSPSDSTWLTGAPQPSAQPSSLPKVRRQQQQQQPQQQRSSSLVSRPQRLRSHTAFLTETSAAHNNASNESHLESDEQGLQMAWEKARKRLLQVRTGTALLLTGGDGGKLRHSQSMKTPSGDCSNDRGKLIPQSSQQHRRRTAKPSPAGSSATDARPPLPAATSKKKCKHGLASEDSQQKSRHQSSTHSASGGKPAGQMIETATAEDTSRRESSCLRSIDGLLQACRQSLGHPSLAGAYADTVVCQSRSLLRRLALYREPEECPFVASAEQLDAAREAARSVIADVKLSGLTQQHFSRLAEALAPLQTHLKMHLTPEIALAELEPGLRLRYFSEYCYLLLEDRNRLQMQSLESCTSKATSVAVCRAKVLLCIAAHFVNSPSLLASIKLDTTLLTRCHQRLRQLLLDGSPDSRTVEQRLRNGAEGVELGNELATLCGQLIQEAQLSTDAAAVAASVEQEKHHQHHQQQRQQHQQQQMQLQQSPEYQPQHNQHQQQQSPDRRSASSHLTGVLGTICSSADCVIRHLKRLVNATTSCQARANNEADIDDQDDVEARAAANAIVINTIGHRLKLSIANLTTLLEASACSVHVKPAFLAKLAQLRASCESDSLSALPFDFFYSVFTDTLLLRRSLAKKMYNSDPVEAGSSENAVPAEQSDQPTTAAADRQSASATNADEVATLLGLISSVTCDLYLAISGSVDSIGNGKLDDSVLGDAFQSELRQLIALVASKHGLACLGSLKRRRLQQAMLRLTSFMKKRGGCSGGGGGGGGGGSGGSSLQVKTVKTLIRLLLEIRLHLDRANLASSDQLWLVEKSVSFSALPRYLALRGSRVLEFTSWSQDTAHLRKMLNPFSKDPAVLRIERQGRCKISLLLSAPHEECVNDSSSVGRRRRIRSCQLVVDLRASNAGSHSACIRLLSSALAANRLTLEPFQATVQVAVKLKDP